MLIRTPVVPGTRNMSRIVKAQKQNFSEYQTMAKCRKQDCMPFQCLEVGRRGMQELEIKCNLRLWLL